MSRLARIGSVFGVVVTVLALSAAARADAGAADDPRDSTGALDVRRVSHTNDDESVTYRVEMWEPIRIDDIRFVEWDFDFDGDGTPADACVIVSRIGTTSQLTAAFYGDCGQETWSTAHARLDGNTLEYTLPTLDLVEGGHMRENEPYSYRVLARDQNRVDDTAPDQTLVTHADVPAPTPRAGIEDTQIGNRTGGDATVGTRPDATMRPGALADAQAATAAQSAPGAEPPGEGRRVSLSIPIVGNLCSGGGCFGLAVGGPAALVFIGWLVMRATEVRRGRRARDAARARLPARSGY